MFIRPCIELVNSCLKLIRNIGVRHAHPFLKLQQFLTAWSGGGPPVNAIVRERLPPRLGSRHAGYLDRLRSTDVVASPALISSTSCSACAIIGASVAPS